jgi:glycosyltransferase involved in cell wall biosynthesis
VISVCMATYNGEKYIGEQISSIMSQIGEHDEVIISDDGSTDRTVAIINDFSDNRIKVFKNNCERGYSRNFENAIIQSRGDIIFLSDQDDVWVEGKVNKMLQQLDRAPMVMSDAIIVDENLAVMNESHFALRGVKRGFWINFLKTRYIGACMAFRREILKKALPFPKNQQFCAYDYWLTLIAEFYYDVKLIEEGLIKYRRHSVNASTGGEKSNNSISKRMLVRGYCFFELLKRCIR